MFFRDEKILTDFSTLRTIWAFYSIIVLLSKPNGFYNCYESMFVEAVLSRLKHLSQPLVSFLNIVFVNTLSHMLIRYPD